MKASFLGRESGLHLFLLIAGLIILSAMTKSLSARARFGKSWCRIPPRPTMTKSKPLSRAIWHCAAVRVPIFAAAHARYKYRLADVRQDFLACHSPRSLLGPCGWRHLHHLKQTRSAKKSYAPCQSLVGTSHNILSLLHRAELKLRWLSSPHCSGENCPHLPAARTDLSISWIRRSKSLMFASPAPGSLNLSP